MKKRLSSKLLLIILDGWGIAPKSKHNAIERAVPRFFHSLWKQYPHATLAASGPAVGLLPGHIGSSEVGHMHIGAGRVVLQQLTRIHRAIDDGTFFTNPALVAAVDAARRKSTRLHLLSLVSDGGVHAHDRHLHALLGLAQRRGVRDVFVHAILDGRDVAPQSAAQYLRGLERAMRRLGIGTLATLCGRHWAMDRNHHWDRTTRALNLLTRGVGENAPSWSRALRASYARGVTDEFFEPTIFDRSGVIRSADSVIILNFRADRMRQIVETLTRRLPRLIITTMTPYGVKKNIAAAFNRGVVPNHFTEVVARSGITQLKIAETQKYAHVTYFFNETRERPYPRERRILVPSEHVHSFADAPEMSAREITNAAVKNFGRSDVIVLNYANADMVGHSGNIEATTEAIRCLDTELARLVPAARQKGYDVMVTADHGNAERMYDRGSKMRHTAHTANPVPFILVSTRGVKIKKHGTLAMVAPLMLELLGIPRPPEMGPSLKM